MSSDTDPIVNTIYFATGNPKKLREAQNILGARNKVVGFPVDVPELQSMDPLEVAKHKLSYVHMNCYGGGEGKLPFGSKFIIEDSCLFTDGLDGLPGPFVKFFGERMPMDKFYSIIASTGKFNASVVCTIAYISGDGNMYYVSGNVSGTIVSPRGTNGFGWDTIFVPNGTTKTFAEMTDDEKNRCSHRALAFGKLAMKIADINN